MDKMMAMFQLVLFIIGLGVLLYGRQYDSTVLFSLGVFLQTSGLLFSFYYVPA
jgi:hypothetical protein